ncbi:DUF397 domain-containing protein [Actinoallomurus sp. CA-150999]
MDLSRTAWRKSSRSGSETNCVETAVVPTPRSGENAQVVGADQVSGGHCC